MGTRVLILDPVGGLAGDMLLGGLCDLGIDVDELRAKLRTLDLPGWSIEAENVMRRHVGATKIHVRRENDEHAHRRLADIRPLIEASELSGRAKRTAIGAFERLAQAEGRVHRCDANEVHFHEVGAVDAIVDICGVALALDWLDVEEILSGPLPAGTGTVQCAHGEMPVPAPAVVELCAERFELLLGEGEGEMVTPTGAALLAQVGQPMPVGLRVRPLRAGYGAGTRASSVLRLTLAERTGLDAEVGSYELIDVLETHVDDVSPEVLGFLSERLFERGAVDVAFAALTMKKGRPGHAITVVVPPDARDQVLVELQRQSGSLGVRVRQQGRFVAPREMVRVPTPWGDVQAKRGPAGLAPEFESAAEVARAHDVPLREVYAAVLNGERES